MSKVDILNTVLIPDYFNKSEMVFKKLNNFPLVKNKDGISNTPINMYLSSYLNNNLSENTIKRTAFCLNILISYCDKNNIKLENFLEDDLINLSRELQLEKDEKGNIRNNTTINNILHNIIKFFDFFGKMFLNNNNYIQNIFNVEEISVSIKGTLKHIKKHKS